MIKIIPTPSYIKIDTSEFLEASSVNLKNDNLNDCVKSDFFDFLATCSISEGAEVGITFSDDKTLEEEEYILKIDSEITIISKSLSGQIYALQTLKQLFFQCGKNLPFITIKDKPNKKIRGFMLDSGRYFFNVEDVKLIIKRMAMHKLNLFHFHITEDQGWRIQIDKYPLLTEKGSVRKRTNFNHKEHKGFYSKDDIRGIIEYAHAFSIKVMPEFDIPGHSRAAIACYPKLSCFERSLPVADHWGVKHDVLCAGKESTYKFVKDVIDEFCELFTDEYFHIGGDEVPKCRWELCPDCQAKIEEEKLSDEDELQCYFMNEIKEYCKKKEKQVFMWSWDLKNDKILDSEIGFTKCSKTDTGNRPFIDTSTSAYYIDLPYGYISLKDSFEHKPFEGNCIGVEATLWTEYVPDMKKADKMTFPRLYALSETGWHGYSNYENISKNLKYYYSYLDKNNIGYSKLKTANPKKLIGFIQKLWFERRQLAWEGLKNIFDDKKVKQIAKQKNK